MTRLELLSPARNLECGKAAIDCGADAVYIGASRFGARAAVGNSVEDIAELCRYAHRFMAKVFVTVNTLVNDDEQEDVERLIKELDNAGVDAVLVQDMAVADMVKATGMALHASTQTDNRTAEKVARLRDNGFERTVLARELSVEEIAEIHRQVPEMPLEVFVHGALCVGYSGLCYASEYCFGRSANRGACAQFCRLKFDLTDSNGDIIEHDRYLLSLKDMNQSGNIGRLIEAGAVSFKIEGRLKDASYVKNVTAAYSQLLDEYIAQHPDKYCRASLGRCKYSFTPDLKKTFNRGFTTYFTDGRKPGIFSPDTPKAIGEYVGKVKEVRGNTFTVAGVAAFTNGDGLCFIRQEYADGSINRSLEGFRVNRVEGNRLFPLKMPAGLRPGTALYRNNDKAFEDILSRQTSDRRIPVTIALEAVEGGFRTEMKIAGVNDCIDEGNSRNGRNWSVSVFVPFEHQEAKRPQRETITANLSKLGGTIFECKEIIVPSDFNLFVPNSLLSDMRRQLTEAMEQKIIADTEACRTKRAKRKDGDNTEDCNVAKYPDFIETPRDLSHHPEKIPSLLMQCRHCLRYALGYCVKHGGDRPTWSEPLYLSLPDGKRFRLDFDCKRCQMNVYAD